MTYEPPRELADLLGVLLDDAITPDENARLVEMLSGDVAARTFYRNFISTHAMMLWLQRSSRGVTPDDFTIAEATPAAPLGRSSSLFFLSPTLHGAFGYLSSGWPVAYLLATVIFGIGALVGSHIYVSRYEHVANNSPPIATKHQLELQPKVETIGRIIGMVDCQWAKGSDPPLNNDAVPLGREFELESGLVEIGYNTGAKVILQGPVTYEVEANGGYLAVGKLTGRLEKKVASGQWSVARKSEISNPQSLISNPSLSTLHSPLFTIKTPTATVTDLGTEFGVEVTKEGRTTSHVFHGSVRLDVAGAAEPASIVLVENESARVEKDGSPEKRQVTLRRMAADPSVFVRQLAKLPKVIDLLDVVAGGNGSGNHRERGIDPITGKQVSAYSYPIENRGDTRPYHPVTWNKLVDGVFTPNGSAGPVQLDSAGHTFDAFDPEGYPCSTIWPYAAVKDGANAP